VNVIHFSFTNRRPAGGAIATGFLVLAAVGAHAQSSAQKLPAEEITYNSHVAAIINENCLVCHREGGIAPMQFTSYEQVRPWAPIIAYKVGRREMPPYAYDHGIGIQDLLGDWRLEQEEIDTILAWVDQGAPLGNPEIVPPVPDIPSLDEWNFAGELGQPDLVLESEPIDIPAVGNDMWHRPYTFTGLDDERCIRAMQVKPKGAAKSVVHHANSSVEIPVGDGTYERFSQLTEYAMGKWGEVMPDGVCRKLPSNGRIAWDIHMYPGGLGVMAPGGVIENNIVELGIWFYDEGYEDDARYEQDLRLYRLGAQEDLVIPPHGYEMTQGFHTFDHPVRIDSYQPHGHLRMRAASLEIFYPETGRTEPISQISNWSAVWHHSHLYEPDVAPLVPAGAVLVLKQWYDNTAENPNNPDPDLFVMGGSRTADEMTHAWLAVTHLDEEGYQELLAKRQQTEETVAAAE
jgi:hypothetical protein